MTTNKRCSQRDNEHRRGMSGHIRTSSLCWGAANGATPQCLTVEPPAPLVTESGLPLASKSAESQRK